MLSNIIGFMFIITLCPHIFKPEIGLEAFAEELGRAAERYNEYFPYDIIHERKEKTQTSA